MSEVYWEDVQRLFEHPHRFYDVPRTFRQALVAATYSCLIIFGAGLMMQLFFLMGREAGVEPGPAIVGGWLMNTGWIGGVGAAVLFVALLLYALLVRLALLVAKRPAAFSEAYAVVAYAYLPLVFSLILPFAFIFALPFSVWLAVRGVQKRFRLELGPACGVVITPLVPSLLLPLVAIGALMALFIFRALHGGF